MMLINKISLNVKIICSNNIIIFIFGKLLLVMLFMCIFYVWNVICRLSE